MAAIFTKFNIFSFKLHKNEYKGACEVADHDSEVENEKWWIQYGGHFWLNSMSFVQIAQKWI